MQPEISRRPGSAPALKDARRRIGMDVKEAEERTKIRAKYLRALEAEDWEVLPAPAYVRGFLRTYGQLLGLDGEMLADEFRRRYEEPAARREPRLRAACFSGAGGPRRLGAQPSRAPLIAAVAAVIVALLVVLAVLNGDDGDERARSDARRPGRRRRPTARAARRPSKPEQEPREPIDFELEALGQRAGLRRRAAARR